MTRIPFANVTFIGTKFGGRFDLWSLTLVQERFSIYFVSIFKEFFGSDFSDAYFFVV